MYLSILQYIIYTFPDVAVSFKFFKVKKLTFTFYVNKHLKYVFIIYVFINNTIYYVYLFR